MNSHNIAGAVNAALDLAMRGYPVFPCSERSKKPTTPSGFKDASANPEEVRRLWRDHPGGLIGVPTGNAIGLDVLDLDFGRHQEARDWWQENRYRIPRTRTHETRSSGLHLLFQHNDLVHCTAGKIRLGVDTRGTGGYIIHWPSTVCRSCHTRRQPCGRIGYWRNSGRSRSHRDPWCRFLTVGCSPSWCR